MKERDFYARICDYYTRNAKCSMSIEVKITKGGTLSWKSLLPHQEELMLQSERAFAYKIADAGLMKKPFDIVLLNYAQAMLIVIFYKPRKSRVYEIPLRKFIWAREMSKEKSLSEAKAIEIGRIIGV